MALCEVALSDGSDLLAEEMKFGLGWNSTSTTKLSWIKMILVVKCIAFHVNEKYNSMLLRRCYYKLSNECDLKLQKLQYCNIDH